VLQGGRALPVTLVPLFAAETLAGSRLLADFVLAEVALDICETVKVLNADGTEEHMTSQQFLTSRSAIITDNHASKNCLHTGLEFQAIWAGKLCVTHTCKDTNITQAMQVNFKYYRKYFLD
jgi:hypothetical protein